MFIDHWGQKTRFEKLLCQTNYRARQVTKLLPLLRITSLPDFAQMRINDMQRAPSCLVHLISI